MDFKEIMKGWRWRIVKVGTTQQALADTVGVSRVHLNMCISGKSSPTVKTFEKIEAAIKELETKDEG